MNSTTRFAFSMVGVGLLVALLVFVGLRADQRLKAIETLQRAPTAPPLRAFREVSRTVTSGQRVYVPVYSHIYANGGQEYLLEATLSIRNTDLEHSLVISSIRYYDTEGHFLEEYLEHPVVLGPLASTDFLVEHRDASGGTGANFLVDWEAENAISVPLIEAIMVRVGGNQAFAFARPGYPLATSPADQAP